MNVGLEESPQRWLPLPFAALLLVLGLGLVLGNWLWRWDLALYDAHLPLWFRPAPDDIVIIAIDDRSLAELGRWPWLRATHGELLRRLQAAGVAAVALDIVFAEPGDPLTDAELAGNIAAHGKVVLPVLPERLSHDGRLIEVQPLPALASAAAALGHVDVELDLDGMARGLFLRAGLGDPHWPQFALALWRVGEPGALATLPGDRRPSTDAVGLDHWVRDHHVLIPFAGPPGHFPRISYVEVLGRDFDPARLRDSFVLVGVTALGLMDTVPTPLSGMTQTMPGVEFNAQVLDSLRRNYLLTQPGQGWRLLFTGVLVLLPALLYPRLNVRLVPLATLGLLALVLAVTLWLSLGLHLWVGPAPALLVVGFSYPLWTGRRLKQLLRRLLIQRQRTQTAFQTVTEAVVTVSAEGRIEYLNAPAERLTGWSLAEALGQTADAVLRIKNPQLAMGIGQALDECLSAGEARELPETSVLVDRVGNEYAIRASLAPLADGGWRSGAMLAISDITELRLLADRVIHQANHDVLTQLPNRRLLEASLAGAIALARQTGESLALLLLDLHRFRRVNEGLGHDAGDRLLQEIGRRLAEGLRAVDTVARLESDSFAIVFLGASSEAVVARRAAALLRALEMPFPLHGHEFVISAAVGIALYTRDGEDAATLLRNADIALSQAQTQGAGTVQFYSTSLSHRGLEHLLLEQRLRRALERGELYLHYQPQIGLGDGRVVGAESLLRWQHPDLGVVSPGSFIPLAEETGLILPIGDWILVSACAQARVWQQAGVPLRVAVNLSPRQFQQPRLAQRIEEILASSGLPPSYLELEITEGLLMQDTRQAIATLEDLRAMGVQLAIDDFGTGYSSLSYLKRLPVQRLKIDQSFVFGIPGDSDDTAIARTVIAMAHSLGLEVVAEGVETAAQLDFLATGRCDEAQGYYISRPVAPEAMMGLLGKSPRMPAVREERPMVLWLDNPAPTVNSGNPEYRLLPTSSAGEALALVAEQPVAVLVVAPAYLDRSLESFIVGVRNASPATVMIVAVDPDRSLGLDALLAGNWLGRLPRHASPAVVRHVLTEALALHRALCR